MDLDGHHEPFDTIMDDAGRWYRNDYGPDWETALNSFATYRKGVPGRAGRLVDGLAVSSRLGPGRHHRSPAVDPHRTAGRPPRGGARRARPHRGRDPAAQPRAAPSLSYRVQADDHRLRRQAPRLARVRWPHQRLRRRGLQDAAPVGRGLEHAGLDGGRVGAVLRMAGRARGPVRLQRFPLPGHRGLRRSGAAQQPLLALPPEGADGRVLAAPGPGRNRHRRPRVRFPTRTSTTATATAASTPSTCGSAGCRTGLRAPAGWPATRSGS